MGLEARLEARFDHKLDQWGGVLLARITAELTASERRLLHQLARHVGAVHESLSQQTSAIDEKYRELPDRVRRLEANVFGPDEQWPVRK